MILKCDVCGGKLQMDAGGKTATCEYCGMTHSLERVREKVQEIKGTVQIEGSVNARQTGTGEDVEQWRALLKKYMAAFDYGNASKIVSKILEALPADEEAGEIYEQLQEDKYFDIKNGVLTKYNGKAKMVTIPYGVTKIGEEAFDDDNGSNEVIIPNSVVDIGNCAFYGCGSLTSIMIPSSVTSIGNDAFNGCGLKSVTFAENSKCISIDSCAFNLCRDLTSISIPSNVTSIGNNAFSGCSSLTSITIPDSVTSIGNGALYGCDNLQHFRLPAGGNNYLPPKILDEIRKKNYLIQREKWKTAGLCQHCGGEFKGFLKKRVPSAADRRIIIRNGRKMLHLLVSFNEIIGDDGFGE